VKLTNLCSRLQSTTIVCTSHISLSSIMQKRIYSKLCEDLLSHKICPRKYFSSIQMCNIYPYLETFKSSSKITHMHNSLSSQVSLSFHFSLIQISTLNSASDKISRPSTHSHKLIPPTPCSMDH